MASGIGSPTGSEIDTVVAAGRPHYNQQQGPRRIVLDCACAAAAARLSLTVQAKCKVELQHEQDFLEGCASRSPLLPRKAHCTCLSTKISVHKHETVGLLNTVGP